MFSLLKTDLDRPRMVLNSVLFILQQDALVHGTAMALQTLVEIVVQGSPVHVAVQDDVGRVVVSRVASSQRR